MKKKKGKHSPYVQFTLMVNGYMQVIQLEPKMHDQHENCSNEGLPSILKLRTHCLSTDLLEAPIQES
jgi:hypothetical protein